MLGKGPNAPPGFVEALGLDRLRHPFQTTRRRLRAIRFPRTALGSSPSPCGKESVTPHPIKTAPPGSNGRSIATVPRAKADRIMEDEIAGISSRQTPTLPHRHTGLYARYLEWTNWFGLGVLHLSTVVLILEIPDMKPGMTS